MKKYSIFNFDIISKLLSAKKKKSPFLIGGFILVILLTYLIGHNKSKELLLSPQNVFADTVPTACSLHNITGFAWSENIGWISFSCANCDEDNNGFIDLACGGDNMTIASRDYGVSIDPDTGDTKGHAWSENIGWISFNRSEAGNPPAAPFASGTGAIAKLDLNGSTCGKKGQLCGWARACGIAERSSNLTCGGNGWDGWIKLQGTTTSSFSYGPLLDGDSNEFSGWAFGGDPDGRNNEAVVGWVSFNCINCEGQPGCSKQTACDNNLHKDYNVHTTIDLLNTPPSASDLQDPDDNQNYCGFSSPGLGQVSFQWRYEDADGDPEEQYELQVDDNDSFSSPEVDIKVTHPTSNSQTVEVKTDPAVTGGNYLNFNTTYHWRVKVYDDRGADSGWVSNPEDSVFSFTTAVYPWPWPNFTVFPSVPTMDEEAVFTDNSICYGDNGAYNCREKNNIYYWDFGDSTSSTQRSATVNHTYEVANITLYPSLQITDYTNSACSCNVPKTMLVILPVPEYVETKPNQP